MALECLQYALTLNAAHPDYHRQLGHALRRLQRWPEALHHYQQAWEQAPTQAAHAWNLFHALRHLKRTVEVRTLLEQALTAFAHDPRWWQVALEWALQAQELSWGLALCGRAPESAYSAHFYWLQGALALKQTDLPQAEVAFQAALTHDPDSWPAWNGLAEVALRQHNETLAHARFSRGFMLRRGVAWNQGGEPRSSTEAPPARISAFKRQHDLTQWQYLESIGLLPAAAATRLPALKAWCNSSPTDAANRLKSDTSLHALWNAPVFLPASEWQGVCLNTATDYTALEAQFLQTEPAVIWWDQFLHPQALEALQAYCLQATIWRDYYPEEGYLGAFMDDGLLTPLLFQLTRELRAALPRLLGSEPLSYLWAFQYDSRSQGIRLHADQARFNLNFWLTPDTANLTPEGGGLLIWDQATPAHWSFEIYNEQRQQTVIQRWLEARQARCQRIPYRQNRAVLFDSRLIHRSDPLCFQPGYENQRINVTMLFGSESGSPP